MGSASARTLHSSDSDITRSRPSPEQDWTNAPWSAIGGQALLEPEIEVQPASGAEPEAGAEPQSGAEPEHEVRISRLVKAPEARALPVPPLRLASARSGAAELAYKRTGSRAGSVLALVATGVVVLGIVAISVRVGATRAPASAAAHRRADARTSGSSLPFPPVTSMERAAAWLQHREGHTAFAVVDSSGRELGLNEHDHFLSASVVKAMLLVAYLRNLAAQHQSLGPLSKGLLFPMINQSDNTAAESVWHIVGDAGLEDVAQASGMTDFDMGPDWANEEVTAADQARFFFNMDSLIPRRFRGYARSLLSGVEPAESWGIPQVARPAWKVFFKGGWRGTEDGQLVSQIARLQQGHRRVAMMTYPTRPWSTAKRRSKESPRRLASARARARLSRRDLTRRSSAPTWRRNISPANRPRRSAR